MLDVILMLDVVIDVVIEIDVMIDFQISARSCVNCLPLSQLEACMVEMHARGLLS